MNPIFAMASLLILTACTHSAVMPAAPPLPWHVNALIGFEPIPGMAAPSSTDTWYYQSSLQLSGDEFKLHKQTVVCRGNRLYSSEGDGGSLSYQGRIAGVTPTQVATVTFVACQGCIEPYPRTDAFGTSQMPISFPSPGKAILGGILYSRDVQPYPRTCPQASA